MVDEIVTAGQSRVWFLEYGPGPESAPAYQGLMRVGDASWPAGAVTPIWIPDPNKFSGFARAGSMRSGEDNATVPIQGRYPQQKSKLLELRRKLCRVDIHVAIGKCGNPQDYPFGWEKLKVYRNGEITSWGDENAGALASDENAATNETGEFSVAEIYEVTKIRFSSVASAEAAREIIGVSICDALDCGDCGDPSDGCQKIFATMLGTGATPGTLPSVLYSNDGGSTWSATDIDTMYSNETPSGEGCVGVYYVVLESTNGAHHYAEKDDIIDGVEIWYAVVSGYVAGGEPLDLHSVDAMHTWIVGNGGYVYFTADITSGVTVQDAGVATTQNLVSVHAFNTEYVLAGGEANALVYTSNGGETWQAVTGPAPGETLKAVYMYSEEVWFVGSTTGGFYYTKNTGVSWTAITLPGSVDNIDAIDFFDDTVGFLAVRQGTRGYVLQTTDGGNSWIVLPRGTGAAIPANDYLNDIAACQYDPNFVIAGGLADDATSGFMVIAQ